MSSIQIPEGYKSALGLKDTQIAIKKVKDFFQNQLAAELNLCLLYTSPSPRDA